jgi:uncharacterized protein YyaL (SSP411 family)
MPNRLANATSPYLKQHQDNPVDWFPWSEEAFAKAASENKPIFLSIGYSSCHWCHVMAHESFEDEAVAAVLNRSFVAVKVDREEQPDVDEAYMAAVQLSSGRGGWPMSVFLTPAKSPFFAGTYFPKDDRGDHPGFMRILTQIEGLWANDRDKVTEIAGQLADSVRQMMNREMAASQSLDASLLDACVRQLEADFDDEFGGFGSAPKFPPHTAIEFLLNYAISDFGTEDLRQSAADMSLSTLEQMALGGIHDHVGGGFHRYSTDARWLLPHFEKMLYDNALLLGNFARAAALCHEQLPELEELFSRTADGIVRWIRDEMTSPEGLFYSALDADSEGEEGRFYVWTSDDADQVLGADSPAFREAFQFHAQGNFHDEASGHTTGSNIPHLLEDTGDRFDESLAKLRKARADRTRPELDDKAIVAWNGMMIAALAEAAELEMAEAAADFILQSEEEHGELPHQIVDGQPDRLAFLDDTIFLADGLAALAGFKSLFEAEGAELPGRSGAEWLIEAKRMMAIAVDRFYDEAQGAFFATSIQHEALFGRTKPIFDQPAPSANAVAAKCLLEFGDDARAVQTLRALSGWMERAPGASEALHLSLMKLLAKGDPPTAVAEVQEPAIEVRLAANRLMAVNGQAEGTIHIQIPSRLHINSASPPAAWLVATAVKFRGISGEAHFPPTTNDRYEGTVEVPIVVELPVGIGQQEFEIEFGFQACTESECLLPETRTLHAIALAT